MDLPTESVRRERPEPDEDLEKQESPSALPAYENGNANGHSNGNGYSNGHTNGSAKGKKPNKWDERGDPFGDETDAQVRYRTMTWWQASLIMIAETISLGILSLPSVLGTIGFVGGTVLIVGLGIVATYTGYVIGQFKMAYPHVHNMADAGEVLLGPIGREIFGAAQVIFLIFIMGSHVLTWTIAFNTMTDHATCTIVWSIVGVVVLFLFTLPRTLKKVSYLSFASFISVFAATVITMIAIGIEKPDEHGHPGTAATTSVSFPTAFQSVTNIIFAYAGHVAFFSFISELKNPNDFPKSLFFLQAWDVSMYTVAAVVIYAYGGADVASPSLGSTSPVVRKVAYGIALPTIVIAGIINGHVAAKYVYVRLFRGTRHMSQKTFLSVGTWLGIIAVFWLLAWIIAESIPVFNDLLGLISALFASWFTYGLSGVFWLFLNKGQWFANWKKTCLFFLNCSIFCLGAAICGIGLYSSGKAIHDDSGKGHSWSCANNAGS